MILTMSPSGDSLRNRCRNFPGIINNSYIDWMFQWPRPALIAVAEIFIKKSAVVPEEFQHEIVQHIVNVHESVEEYTREFLVKLRSKNYVTPKQFLDFIKSYLKLLSDKNDYITSQCNRLITGLEKIKDASVQLHELNFKLGEQKQIVMKANKTCDSMLIDIKTSKSILRTVTFKN